MLGAIIITIRMKPKIPKNKNNQPPVADGEKSGGGTIGDDASSDLRNRYIGVTYRSRRKKFQARMYRGSYEYNLGLFDLAADAALAYDAAHRVAGGRGSGPAPPSSPKADVKLISKVGANSPETSDESSMVTGAEEIIYALDWIDCASGTERPSGLPEDDPMHLNFLRPSDFREAREKEISSHKANSSNDNNGDTVFPTELDLKLRIKKEILNIAKTYVMHQAKTSSSPDDSDMMSSSDDEAFNEGGNNFRQVKKRKLHMDMSASDDYGCREMLSLNRKSPGELKKAARAQKLTEFMTGGEASVDSNINNDLASKSNHADALGKDSKPSASDAESIQQQLQQNLAKQQALTIDSFHGSFNQGALMRSLLSQYSLEQVLRFAVERPDLVNEDTIGDFVRGQRTNMSQQIVHNNQTDLLYAQLQAAMMTGGHFNPTQLPVGLQALVAELKPSQSAGVEVIKRMCQDGVGDGAGTLGQASGGEKPPGESPLLVDVLEEYRKQCAGNQGQLNLQKKITNEAKRAALAQKLSIHLSNETKESFVAETIKTNKKEKSDSEPPVMKAIAVRGDSKNKDIKQSKLDDIGNSSHLGVAASSEVKPTRQENAMLLQSVSVPGLVTTAGLQQALPLLQSIDPFQQAILQHVTMNGNAQQDHLHQSFGGGDISALLAQEVSNRRFAMETLMNEEYRLQQLRQSLQTQTMSPYLNFGDFGVPGSNNVLSHMASNNTRANGLPNSLIQQGMNSQNQDLLLQQVLALQANQNASMGGALQPAINEQMLQSQGIDARALTQMLLSQQLRGGLSQPPS